MKQRIGEYLEIDDSSEEPAIIETPITTILIDMDQRGTVDEYLNVVVTREV